MEVLLKLKEAFKHITYYDFNHTYISDDQLLTSCTAVLKELLKYKDWDLQAEKSAKKAGVTKQEMKHEWYVTGLVGRSRGSYVHKYIEDKIANKVFPTKYDPNLLKVLDTETIIGYHKSVQVLKTQADNFLRDSAYLVPIMSEVVVGDYDIGIAGTFDQLFYNTRLEQLQLFDWKTDKKFERFNEYNNKFKVPLDYMHVCEFNKYALQLSIYRYILEKYVPEINLAVNTVVWFCINQENYQLIELPYLKEEVELLLKNRQ